MCNVSPFLLPLCGNAGMANLTMECCGYRVGSPDSGKINRLLFAHENWWALNDYIRLLTNNPNFAKLWGAQVISLLGDWFNTIVLSTLVARYSGGSGLAISLFLMSRFLPPLFVGPFAGVLVDRFDRKAILIYSDILRTGVVLLFLFAASPDRLWLIYVLTIIQFTISAIFEPGRSAILPALVSHQGLVLANTLSSITWSVMLAVGAIIGGIVGALFGPVIALTIDALTFAVAAFLIWTIDVPKDHIPVVEHDPDDSGSLLDGLRYLRRNPAIAAVLLVKGGGSLGNIDTLMTIYATEIFVIGLNGQLSLGILYSSFGLGAIMGPLLLNRFNNGSVLRMAQLITIGFMLAVAGWVTISIGNTLLVIAIALVIRAMGGSANWTYSSVIIQKSVPDRLLGRVFALDYASFQLATVFTIIVHGTVIDFLRSGVSSTYALFDVSAVMFASSSIDLLSPVTAHDLRPLAIVTTIVSIVPLALWMGIMPRMKRRHQRMQVSTVR